MTNPDTSTLNGALEQLGITMADNLNTMGVSDADPSDGLTTLANKILDITPGPGPTPTPASIDLTGTKSILSYADSEQCVLTATVLDSSDNPVEGVTVNLYKGSTLWDTLTTDSSGECSKTYTSTGSGDITFTAEVDGTLVTETYGIEDCRDYQPLTSNAHESRWTIPSGVTSVYDNTGWKVSANAYKQVKLTDKLTNACSVEFTVVDYSNTYDMAIIIYAYTNGETTPNQKILTGGSSVASEWYALGTINHNLIKGGKYRIEYTSSTLKVYENDVLLGSATNNVGLPTRFEFHTSSNRWAIYKDLKVKPL